MTVQWLAEALLNLADILDTVAEESPQGAEMLAAEFQSKTAQLETHPKLYKAGRVRGTRECVATENYLLVYRLEGDDVHILRVLHTRRQWPSSPKKR
ncbi:YafQ toxin protein [Caballeronia glathei]|uniref:Addiction module antitoxin n=1 Tax=Caballeronia glathei TaxID=60547 RepID=A0A069PIV1_9BURK|nr:type II toxin-antitoxin system RelE/ParE family toxin [Caballeronia glathei]KDR39854.1 addiction module antitoxin [Caballeronia glathei]CDY78041.1 YafQ toxin protein [Caballeronia glathei]